MKDPRFEIGVKSENLLFSVFDITTNRSHFPVKFRRLADKMQEYALQLHSDLLDANSIVPNCDTNRRIKFELQTSAISICNKFMALVKYVLHSRLISSVTAEKWVSLVSDIKYMTLAWRKS